MNDRELHVPRYRGQATDPMGLYVAENDHDRVVALLQEEISELRSHVQILRDGGSVSKGEMERLEEFKRQVRENRR